MRAVVLAALLLVGAACGTPGSKCGPATGTVDYVIDGDTVVLNSGTKIRLLLVDTPEITQGHNDCWGQEAKTFTSGFVTGKTLQLSYDEGSCTDRYGRTLAYVKVDGAELNTQLIQQGYACFLYVKPGGMSRQDEFSTYEAEAKTNKTGMWGACTLIPCSM
ncbi:MAG: thermonuclease family protein [Myxococcaceae bacterium]